MSAENKTVLTLIEVRELTSLSKPTIYKYIRDGMFPRQMRIGPNRVVWRASEIVAWLNLKAGDRDRAEAT